MRRNEPDIAAVPRQRDLALASMILILLRSPRGFSLCLREQGCGRDGEHAKGGGDPREGCAPRRPAPSSRNLEALASVEKPSWPRGARRALTDLRMKLSDYVVDFIARCGVRHVFLVPGGGAMHLNDSAREGIPG